jgi:hypothetical protein
MLTFCLVAPQQFFCDPLESCSLLFAQLMWNPLCSDFSLLQCLSHDLKTEAVDMLASCAISSHDLRRSSSNRVLTITTDLSSVAVTGRPLLGPSWMLTRPSRKQDAHRDTMLRSTTLFPQTSCKPLWISVGFFPRKISTLMYDRWSLREIRLLSVSSPISRLRFAEQGPRSLLYRTHCSLPKSGPQLSRKSERLLHPTGHATAVCRTFEMTHLWNIIECHLLSTCDQCDCNSSQ